MATKIMNTINGQTPDCKLVAVQTQNSVYFLNFENMTYQKKGEQPKPLVSVSDIKIGNNLVLLNEAQDRCITTSPIQGFLAV